MTDPTFPELLQQDGAGLRAEARFIVANQSDIKTRVISSVTVSANNKRAKTADTVELQIPSKAPKDNAYKAFYQALGEEAGLGKLPPSIFDPVHGNPLNPYFTADGNSEKEIKAKLVKASGDVAEMSKEDLIKFTRKVSENYEKLNVPVGPMENNQIHYGANVTSKVQESQHNEKEPAKSRYEQLTPAQQAAVAAVAGQIWLNQPAFTHAEEKPLKLDFHHADIMDLQAPLQGSGHKRQATAPAIKK